jgi:Skp family chaperone for outer membrane proteins
MNETARIQLEKEIEKQTKDAERFQQDAQAEINELQQEVQNEFVKKLSPIVEALAVEKGLHLVFNAAESGIAWAAPGLDLTADVIKKLDATAKPAAATPKN